MACPEVTIQTILGTECIGDSLPKINTNFSELGDATCDLITDVTNLSSYTNNLTTVVSNLSTSLVSLSSQTTGSGSGSSPTGSVTYYSLSSAPTGWIECNGAALTVAMGSTYTNLRTLLVNANNPFGVSGSDPKVPDLRGRFIRSFGTDSTVSPVVSSAAFGVKQADDFESHTHTFVQNYTLGGGVFYNAGAFPSGPGVASNLTTGSTGSTETRPANLALLACIKL